MISTGKGGNMDFRVDLGKSQGFTLIELMIVVAVIAILARLALPSYQDYVARGKIPQATAALSEIRNSAEQYFADHRVYTGASCTPSAATPDFTVACEFNDSTFTITATGSSSSGMGGYEYTINQASAKTSTTPQSSGSCWITRNGGSC
jgi:type IV pilus assembly protein PilE